MLSKNKIKFIRSLELKKVRKEEQVFLAEGEKIIRDIAPHFYCRLLVATPDFLNRTIIQADEIIEVTPEELKKASLLITPQQALGVFEQAHPTFTVEEISGKLSLALDGIQDPGNLGTIIRLADWFGIEHIFCSENCVNLYNPKVIQATMGAIAHVAVHTCPLSTLFTEVGDLPVYGTFLDGEDMYESALSANGIIVMGNEGNGISKELEPFINQRLFIPNYPLGSPTTESLNVGVATAIISAEFRRRFR